MPGKKIILLYKWIKISLTSSHVLNVCDCFFFQACRFASEPALKSVHLFGQSYDHKTLVENKASLVDGSMVRGTPQEDFFVGRTFEEKKPLTFSLNILCIIHDSFLQLQLILIQDFSAGCYYFINIVFFQLQTIELYRYLAL